MNMQPASIVRTRPAADAGIAIGPILFIIAVLGVLAAAIAAGSGSFSTSTTNESDRTKAAALIDIGQTLKAGMDRLLSENDAITAKDVIIDPTNTTVTTALFSPIGGGIGAPSRTMSKTPTSANDVWFYPMMLIPNIGTVTASYGGVTGNRVAVIEVSAGVCDEINSKANAIAKTNTPGASPGATQAVGDLSTATTTNIDATVAGHWPTVLVGKPTGCFLNSVATTGGPGVGSYWFYQVVFVQ